MRNPFKIVWGWIKAYIKWEQKMNMEIMYPPSAWSEPPMPKTLPPKNQKPTRREFMEKYSYSLAEKDGFRKDPLDYWLAAEKHAEHCIFRDDP